MKLLVIIFLLSCSSKSVTDNKTRDIELKILSGFKNSQLKIYDSGNQFTSLIGDSIVLYLNKKTYFEYNSQNKTLFYIDGSKVKTYYTHTGNIHIGFYVDVNKKEISDEVRLK